MQPRPDRDEDPRDVRVLYVENDPDEAEVTAGHLEREAPDLTVVVETDPDAGLDRIETERVDCVVSEYRLPGTDGVEFLGRIRERRPRIPFVLFTGHGSERVASEAISAGVTDYLRRERGTDQYAVLAGLIHAVVREYRAGQYGEHFPEASASVGDAGERRERERELEELSRINRTLRETIQAVVRASSVAEVRQVVCERLADSEPYLFAWIGTVDEDDTIRPRAWAGVEEGYLDAITVTADESETGRGPGDRAVRTGEPRVMRGVRSEPRRGAALERGYESSASIPLEFEDELYGVLNVYADRPRAFDDLELAVLSELGTTVAHAIDRIELNERLEEQYRTLFQESPVMAVETRDVGGEPVVDDCNRRFLETLGYDREEVIGEELAAFYTEQATDELLGGGYERALRAEFSHEERQLVTADGEVVETLLRAVPRRDGVGEVVGTLALYVDVTDRKRAEEVLQQATAMEAAIDGMAILDADGEFVYVNEAYADIHGYDDPTTLEGQHWRTRYPDSEIERLETEVLPAVRESGRWQGEATGLRRDGTTFPQAVSVSILEEGVIVVVRDVSGRKRHERELERQNERLEAFASVVSHDLRNPLNVLQGRLQLAREEPQDAGLHVEKAEQAADRMERLIDDLLTLARQGQALGETGSIQLAGAAQRAWSAVSTRNATLSVETDAAVEADGSRLEQLLGNLFGNAVDHAGPDVTVEVGDCPGGFYVADDGPGIPPDDRERVFEYGYSEGGGTGFGLAIVSEIAEAHGWSVTVTEGEDGGARFEFTGVEFP